MTARLQVWFARQPLWIKLALTVPPLIAALLWSSVGPDAARSAPAPARATVTSADPPASTLAGPAAAPAPAHATLTPYQEPRAQAPDLSWETLVRALVSLGAVLALVVLGAHLLRQIVRSAGGASGTGAHVRVVDTTYLPSPSGRGRAAIHVVEVGERLLIVGATESQLTMLTEFDDAAPAARTRPESSGDGQPFAQALLEASLVPSNGTLAPGVVPPDARNVVLQGARGGKASGMTAPAEASAAFSEALRRLRESTHRLEGSN